MLWEKTFGGKKRFGKKAFGGKKRFGKKRLGVHVSNVSNHVSNAIFFTCWSAIWDWTQRAKYVAVNISYRELFFIQGLHVKIGSCSERS